MTSIKTSIINYWDRHPLLSVMWIAVFLRLVAVIFARGWGMLDDHFLVIEIAQSWIDDGNFNHWLPWDAENEGPTGHSFFYAGLHYYFFRFLEWLHLTDPQSKMLVVRALHGAWSLVVVYLGFRIAHRLADVKAARLTGLLLAAFWFMPWISVRNLVEVFAIPFLMISIWMLMIKNEHRREWLWILAAGFVAGIAFSVRFQTAIFAGGLGLVLLWRREIRQALLFGAGYLVAIALLQGLVDIIIWQQPFAELTEYVRYNMTNRYGYLTGEWYKYLVVLIGFLIPPVSIFLLIGMFKHPRKYLLILLPTLLFLAFHSWFPNKQERFIITIIPFIITIGVPGWLAIVRDSSWLQRHRKWISGSWIFFLIINTLLLFAVSTMYSKRAPVEAMSYLKKYKDIEAIVVDNSTHASVPLMPQFYLDQWVEIYEVTTVHPVGLLPRSMSFKDIEPDFVLFIRDEELPQRLEAMRELFPELEYETTAEPGFLDKMLHWLNPHNKNDWIIIYRNMGK
ncbi:MAG TPA: glycosyltransferase family 39 protein [Bacteroidales bacterium]|nr:glycosyltransferase family 39 protein [Bacteroidales bacterium]